MNASRVVMVFCLVLALAVVGGCNDDAVETTEVVATEATGELTPEELGALGAEIEANPDQLDALLAERGLTLETYEAAIRAITEDPGEAQRYAEAYENARG